MISRRFWSLLRYRTLDNLRHRTDTASRSGIQFQASDSVSKSRHQIRHRIAGIDPVVDMCGSANRAGIEYRTAGPRRGLVSVNQTAPPTDSCIGANIRHPAPCRDWTSNTETSSGIGHGDFVRYRAPQLRPVSGTATSSGIRHRNFARYQAPQLRPVSGAATSPGIGHRGGIRARQRSAREPRACTSGM